MRVLCTALGDSSIQAKHQRRSWRASAFADRERLGGTRHRLQSSVAVPLLVFDTKGIPATRRERIVTAVEAGGKHMSGPHEAWITTDPFRGGVRVLITGPQGFERVVQFAMDEDLVEIIERVRATMDE